MDSEEFYCILVELPVKMMSGISPYPENWTKLLAFVEGKLRKAGLFFKFQNDDYRLHGYDGVKYKLLEGRWLPRVDGFRMKSKYQVRRVAGFDEMCCQRDHLGFVNAPPAVRPQNAVIMRTGPRE